MHIHLYFLVADRKRTAGVNWMGLSDYEVCNEPTVHALKIDIVLNLPRPQGGTSKLKSLQCTG